MGVTFGLLINPYFPDNIIFGVRQMLPKILGQAEVRVCNEWCPYETTQLLGNSTLALIAFLSGVVYLSLQINDFTLESKTKRCLGFHANR